MTEFYHEGCIKLLEICREILYISTIKIPFEVFI